jgi:hypothetical protein
LPEVAGLNLSVNSDSVKQATAELRQMAPAATAAEKTTQKLTAAANAASAANENFSRRVQGAIKSLEFERAQLARSSDERERYAAVRRAGVAEASAEGRAIMASVAALQQQRSAQQAAAESMKLAQQQAAGLAAMARQRAAEEAAAAAQQANLLRQEQAQRDALAAKQAAQEAQRRATAAAVVADLNFERQQLTRTAAEQAKYAALRRAGVSASSAEGQAIVAAMTALQQQKSTQQAIAALQAQRSAIQGVATATSAASTAATVAAGAFRTLWTVMGPLAIAMLAVQQAMKAWDAGMKAADLGEEAEQVNLTTDALQAFRFQAVQNGVEVATLDQAMIRLTSSMGKAAEGGKEQIETFQKLGVKLLDSNGQLRSTADVLPEVARGLLAMESGTERNAMLTEMFGKSGARVVTMLQDWAQGTDMVINKARAQGGVLEADVINQWDKVSDSLAKAGVAADVAFARLGAPIATWALEKVAALLESINANLARLKQEAATATVRTLQNDTAELESQIAAQRGLLAINPNNPMALASIKALEARLAASRNAAGLAEMAAQQGAIQLGGAPSANVSQVLPVITPGSTGVGDPKVKKTAGAGSDPYAKAIESAKDYIATKNAEAHALGMNAEAAARLKHETELLNKASNDNTILSASQVVALKAQAAAMAEADAAFAGAKFMDDAITKSSEFIAAQEIERATLWMSTEAAMAYRLEQEYLNAAKAQGIELSAADAARLRELATAQAASAEQTRQAKEIYDLAKDSFHGFLSDLKQGIQDGKSFWDSFGNAALNALNTISNKLLEMAANKLFESAFGGSGGSSGGFLSGLGGLFSGMFGGGATSAGGAIGPGTGYTYANGAAFHRGNVIPFARGGIVSRPTLFPMANGAGLMGEAGPEGVLPLRRGRGGRLGVEASGVGGTVVNVYNYADGTKATTKESKGPGGQIQIDVIVESVEAKMAGRVARGQGALGRTIESKYGLQAQGRG